MPDIHSAHRTAAALTAHFADRPFRAAEAQTVVTARALRTALGRGTVIRLHRGVLAVPAEGDRERYRQRIAAALAARPGSVASHESALALLGCSLPHFGGTWDELPVRLTTPDSSHFRCDNPDLVIIQRPVPPHHAESTPWGPATSPGRTAADMARALPVPTGLGVADECCALLLLRRSGWSGDVSEMRRDPGYRELVAGRAGFSAALLREAVNAGMGCVGNPRARLVAAYVDPAAESPGESLSRARLLMADLPRPVLAHPVTGDNGAHYYADLAWPEYGVLGEVDGDGKYRDDPWQVFRREKVREHALRGAGWTIVRWTVSEMLADPHRVVARVLRTLRTAR